MKIIILLTFFPLSSFAQMRLDGTVVNKETREKVPFATVGLIKANKGTNADEAGQFHLMIFKDSEDTLLISSVGYKSLKTAVGQLNSNTRFELEYKPTTLNEVIISAHSKRTMTINDFSWCGFDSWTSSGFITQMAQLYQAPVKNSKLTEVHICKERGKARFRIRVYGVDTISKQPSPDLTDAIIEVDSEKRHIYVDLEKYKILIPDKNFYIAIEWLAIPYNERKWKRKAKGSIIASSVSYHPFIFCRKLEETEVKPWFKTYAGEWEQLSSTKLAISIKVKY